MLNLLKALRQDEHGVILSAEIVIIGSLLVIGLISGLTCLQKSVNGELRDLAGAIDSLDQTYSFSGHRKSGFGGQCCAYTAGSGFVNCEQKSDKCGDIVGCGGACTVETGSCTSGNCGQCGTCTNAVGWPEGGSGCGVCGGQAGGCSTCGGSGYLNKTGARCIDTGVPKMKVTEWPQSNHSEEFYHPVPPSPVWPAFPSTEGHVHGHDVMIEQPAQVMEHSAPIHQSTPTHQGAPVVEEQIVPQQPSHQNAPVLPPMPAPAGEPSLLPVPEVQPIPANPMPPMARAGRPMPVVLRR